MFPSFPLKVKFIKEQEFLFRRKIGGGEKRKKKRNIFKRLRILSSVLFVSDNLRNEGKEVGNNERTERKKKALTRIHDVN